MKKALVTLAQFVLFLVLFAVGSFLHPLNIHSAPTITASTSRYFIADGLLLALGVFLAIVAVQAIRRRLCNTTWTILAFVLAIAVGYAMKFGFVTRDLI